MTFRRKRNMLFSTALVCMWGVSVVTLCCTAASEMPSLAGGDIFHERLLVRQLADGSILTQFRFHIESDTLAPSGLSEATCEGVSGCATDMGAKAWSSSVHLDTESVLVSKPLLHLFQQFSPREWRLRLTQGRWLTNRWGLPDPAPAPLSADPLHQREPSERSLFESFEEPVSAPFGAELWASFFPSTPNCSESRSESQVRWLGLQQTLSGLFCASLNEIGMLNTVHPSLPAAAESRRVFYGALPRENVCTENITPWLKQLPCGRAAGLSALLRPHAVFDSLYHSLSLHFFARHHASSPQTHRLVLSFSIAVVFAPLTSPLPTPMIAFSLAPVLGVDTSWKLSACPVAASSTVHLEFPSHLLAPLAWPRLLSLVCADAGSCRLDGLGMSHYARSLSLHALRDVLFAAEYADSLPEAETSSGKHCLPNGLGSVAAIDSALNLTSVALLRAVFGRPRIDDLDKSPDWLLRLEFIVPTPPLFVTSDSSMLTWHLRPPFARRDSYSLSADSIAASVARDAASVSISSSRLSTLSESLIVLRRYVLAAGGQRHRATLQVDITNLHSSLRLRAYYLDVLPWFITVFRHTLLVSGNPRAVSDAALHELTFVPAEHRQSPSQLELLLSLPPESTISITVQIEKNFLTTDDFPPDVSRGFDLPCAVLTLLGYESTNATNILGFAAAHGSAIYSDPLLLLLPWPDFSMPFNVIALSSTLVAFFFSSLFNMMFRADDDILASMQLKPA